MEICNNGHTEIVYADSHCPMCVLIDDYDEKVKASDRAIANLEDEIHDLTSELGNKSEGQYAPPNVLLINNEIIPA